MKSGFTYVAALSNNDAQYWGIANPSSGAFSITNVLPGTYTLTIYKGELGVYTSSVTVSAGGAVALHTITVADPSDAVSIFRIGKRLSIIEASKANHETGDWDGSPAGFTNFDKTPMLVC